MVAIRLDQRGFRVSLHRAVSPKRSPSGRDDSVGISKAYGIGESERFITDAERLGTTGFKKQVLAGILFDAHISSAKYGRVLRAIRFLAFSAVFAAVYLLILQF